jgi:uncharacterized protein
MPETMLGGPERDRLVPRFTMDQLAERLKPAAPPPGVVPKTFKAVRMAMDEGELNSFMGWMSSSWSNLAFVEGYTFLGYPVLSQLAQISEYRQVSETIADESTRKWIEIKSKSDDAGQADRIADLEAEMKRLGVRRAFNTVSRHDGFFGRAHLYLDTGDTDDRPELMKSLGTTPKEIKRKLSKGQLRALKTVEPVWCYPARYDAADPLKDNWYRPESWFVNGKEVHSSRLLPFVGREVPDLMKPSFSFGGLSLSQMIKPYVDNWLETRQSVNDIIKAFSVMVLKTDLSGLLQSGGAELDRRIAVFNNYRNNKGVMAISKADEDFANVAAPLGSLDKLQAQAQEHMAAPPRIPLIKLTGITPSGLNASSDGELRAFDERQHGYQESFYEPHLGYVFKLVQINLWGEVDEDLEYRFKPLFELNEEQQANVDKIKAETDAILIDKSVLAPAESRKRLAEQDPQPYGEIEPDDVPEPVMPEEGNIKERIGGGEGDE